VTEDICESLQAASRGWVGDAPDGSMLKATRAFLARAQTETEVLQQAAACLQRVEPGAAAWIAVACGTAVEKGAPAEITGPAVFDLLRSWLPQFPTFGDDPEVEPQLTPAQRALLPLFRYLCQGVVTHLARLPAQRESMGRDVSLIDRLGELQSLSHGAVWVREALLKSSGSLLFLQPTHAFGVKLRYDNVSNCFHLFSLLQTALGTFVPDGRPVDSVIARVARGKISDAVQDEAWWHYGHAHSSKADIDAMIPGEGLVRDIPRIDDALVILAWPPILKSRGWDGAFLGPHLDAMPADARIESALSKEDIDAWFQRLKIGGNPWWKFWA
jgi:hypothetical protein